MTFLIDFVEAVFVRSPDCAVECVVESVGKDHVWLAVNSIVFPVDSGHDVHWGTWPCCEVDFRKSFGPGSDSSLLGTSHIDLAVTNSAENGIAWVSFPDLLAP